MRSRFVSDPRDNSASLDTNVLPWADLALHSGGEAPHQTETPSPAPTATSPDLPPATTEDVPAGSSDAAPADSLASPDVEMDAANPPIDSSMASTVVTSAGAGSINVIGTPVETNAGVGLHIAPPIDSDFGPTAEALLGPAASASTPAVSINLASLTMPTSFGGHGVETVANSSGVEAAVAHPTTSQAGADVGSPGTAITSLAFLDNSGGITNSANGTGATAAQLQQALDESGLSVNGSGIKVGVLSDSFNDLGGAAVDEADGALPSASSIQVLSDLASGGSDEGRAMMQIIHESAPGAGLAFYTADNSEQDFANGILALAAAGCKVICDDVSYFDEPFFQNGVVAQAIEKVESEGVTFVTSAGNDASNAYQATWTAGSGSFDNVFFNDAELFNGSLTQTITVTASSADPVPLVLEWSLPYGQANFATGSAPDIDLFIFHNGSLVAQETNVTAGEANNPFTGFEFTASGTYQIAISNNFGPNPSLIKEIMFGDGLPETINGANAGTVSGHHMTPGAITAGAVNAADTLPFGISPTNESFSSSGLGTELLFSDNGSPLSSPDQLSPVAVSSIDGIATTVPGNLHDFFGTSAASASLAGVAALMLSADPNLTPAQVEQIMEQTALPMGNSVVAGAGLVQVDAAVAASTPLAVDAASTEALQGGAPVALSTGVTINDPGTTISGATITIANASGNPLASDELFVQTASGIIQDGSLFGVTIGWNDTTKVLTLSGTASIATYEDLLGLVNFQDFGTDTLSGSHPVHTVTWTVNDGTNSFDATSQVTIDRAPTVSSNITATDTAGATITATAANGVLSNASDLDGDKVTVTGVSDTAHGAVAVGTSLAGAYGHLTLNADGSYSYAADNTAAISVAATGAHLQEVFNYTMSDGHGGTANASLTVALDRAPAVSASNTVLTTGPSVVASSLFSAADPDRTRSRPTRSRAQVPGILCSTASLNQAARKSTFPQPSFRS